MRSRIKHSFNKSLINGGVTFALCLLVLSTALNNDLTYSVRRSRSRDLPPSPGDSCPATNLYSSNTLDEIFLTISAVAALVIAMITFRYEYRRFDVKDDWVDEPVIVDEPNNPHEDRLEKIGFEGDIPDEFLDCTSFRIMFKPVIPLTENTSAFGQPSIDESTALRLLREEVAHCPISRLPFTRYIGNLSLANTIEAWVKEQVKLKESQMAAAAKQREGLFKAPSQSILRSQSLPDLRKLTLT